MDTEQVDKVEQLEAAVDAAEQELARKDQLRKAVEMAVRDYRLLVPRIKDLTNYVSHRKIKKVLMAAVTFPISDKPAEFKQGSAEEQLFIMIVQAQMAKNLIVNFYNSDADVLGEAINTVSQEVQSGME